MEERKGDCPCKRTECQRHGDCIACREHHAGFRRKMRVACDRLEEKKEKQKKR